MRSALHYRISVLQGSCIPAKPEKGGKAAVLRYGGISVNIAKIMLFIVK